MQPCLLALDGQQGSHQQGHQGDKDQALDPPVGMQKGWTYSQRAFQHLELLFGVILAFEQLQSLLSGQMVGICAQRVSAIEPLHVC
jgi:hypothetical protein